MKYILIVFLFLCTFSLQAQKSNKNSKRSVSYRKLSFEHKEIFLLDKVKRAKESKDYESLEDWNLELKKLREHEFYSADQMLENGFFADALIGPSLLKTVVKNSLGGKSLTVDNGLSFALRFGNKWYLGSKRNYNYGLQLTYLNVRTSFKPKIITSHVNYSLANLGFINLFQFKKNIGLELNINAGYNVLFAIVNLNKFYSGYHINPELKIRFRKLALGLDYSFTQNVIRKDYNVFNNCLSFSFGAKF